MRGFFPSGSVGASIQLVPLFVGLNTFSKILLDPSVTDAELFKWAIITFTFLFLIFDAVREYSSFEYDSLSTSEKFALTFYSLSLLLYAAAISRFAVYPDPPHIGYIFAALFISSAFEVLFCILYWTNYPLKKEPKFDRSDYSTFAAFESMFLVFYGGITYVILADTKFIQLISKLGNFGEYVLLLSALLLVLIERILWVMLRENEAER